MLRAKPRDICRSTDLCPSPIATESDDKFFYPSEEGNFTSAFGLEPQIYEQLWDQCNVVASCAQAVVAIPDTRPIAWIDDRRISWT